MRLLAPAKINLGLSIKRKLSNGYHLVEMINTQVSLCDELEIEVGATNAIKLDKNNTMFKTLELIDNKYNITKWKHNIPEACGLGGASSDVAAILKHFDKEDLVGQIGKDVAYAYKGGIKHEKQGYSTGSTFKNLPALPNCWIVIVVPKVKISTKVAYRLIDKYKFPASNLSLLINAVKNSDLEEIGKNLVNDFYSLTVKLCPEIEEIKKIMNISGALGVSISGKGPAVFGIFKTKETANHTLKPLVKDGFEQVFLVKSIKEKV